MNPDDTSGNLVWENDDPIQAAGSSVSAAHAALDDSGDLFACADVGAGQTGLALYAPDGSAAWRTQSSFGRPVRADVTGGVARCVGTSAGGVSVVAFATP